jgi:hypothetical protein
LQGDRGRLQWPKGFRRIVLGSGKDWRGREADTLDGVIDELRISSIARYRSIDGLIFTPPRQLTVDKHTTALFRFEGDVIGKGPGGKTFKADFADRH